MEDHLNGCGTGTQIKYRAKRTDPYNTTWNPQCTARTRKNPVCETQVTGHTSPKHVSVSARENKVFRHMPAFLDSKSGFPA